MEADSMKTTSAARTPSKSGLLPIGKSRSSTVRHNETVHVALDEALDTFRDVLVQFRDEAGGKTKEEVAQQSDEFILNAFEAAWKFGGYSDTWQRFRGDLGECVGHWMSFVRSMKHLDEVEAAYGARLARLLLGNAPEMLDVEVNTEPFLGQTWLMQVVANGDEAMVSEMVRHTQLHHVNAVSQGFFLASRTKCPVDTGITFKGVSVLEIAMIAPKDDDTSVRMVKLLIEAGADPDNCGQIAARDVHHRSSLLQRVACSRWTTVQENEKGKESALISANRMLQIVQVLNPRIWPSLGQ